MALQSVGYLLGQGIVSFRPWCAAPIPRRRRGLPSRFNFKPGTLEADIESVEQAAIALGLFGGGLGSRARRAGLAGLQNRASRTTHPRVPSIESVAAFIQTLDFSAPMMRR